jgi:hypothetical protein
MLLLMAAVVFAGLGYAVGNSRGRAAEGILWGFFLGPIGVAVVALRPAATQDGQRPAAEQGG